MRRFIKQGEQFIEVAPTQPMRDLMRSISPEQAIYIECLTALELDSAAQNAHQMNRQPRPDGFRYKIRRSAKDMSVTVQLEPV